MKKIMVCVVLFHIVSCFLVNNGHIVIGVKTVFANKTIDNMTSMDHISCGFDFENKGQYEDAIKEFSLAITKDSSYYLAFMCRGDIYKLQGKYGAAIDDYNKAITLAPYANKASLHCRRGEVFYRIKKYYSALRDYNEAILFDCNYVEAYLHRSRLYADLNEKNKAVIDCNKVLQLDTSFYTYENVALTYDLLDDYKKSVEYYKLALSIAPRERAGKIQGWLNEALAEYTSFENLHKVHTESAEGYWLVSSSYNKDENYIKAYEYALKAVQLNEQFGYAYISLGESLIGQHKYDEGLNTLNNGLNYVKSDLERAALYRERGKGYLYKKNYNQAINDFNKSIMYDELSVTYFLRGDAYRNIQEYNKAYADYQKVVVLDKYSQWSCKAYYALEEIAPYVKLD